MTEATDLQCRVCIILNSAELLLPLNFKQIICEKEISLREIIRQCCSVQIQEDYSLPQNMCKCCMENARIAFKFLIQCQQAEMYFKKLKESLDNPNKEVEKFACHLCTKLYETKAELVEHICTKPLSTFDELENDDPKQPSIIHNLADPLDLELKTLVKNFISHEKERTKKLKDIKFKISTKTPKTLDKKKEKCTKPVTKSRSKILTTLHVVESNQSSSSASNEEGTNIEDDDQEDDEEEENSFETLNANSGDERKCFYKKYQTQNDQVNQTKMQFKCISCNIKFGRRKELSEHYKIHTDFKCTLCPAKFSLINNLRTHIQTHISKRPPKKIPSEKRTCDICFKVFNYRTSMLKHRKKHNSVPEKHCKHCDAVFKSSVKLYQHMDVVHQELKEIVCSECGKRFFKESNLKAHISVHTGERPFMCDICGLSFALSGSMVSHRRLHTGEKPFKCRVCGKGFAQSAARRSHEVVHSDKKDYPCPDCGRAFSRPGAMRNHRKRHLTEKPFKCSFCDKRFTFANERKRHMTIHSGEKNYICDVCGKAFNRNSNLLVHRRIHTGETPFVCKTCGKGFIQSHCLKSHACNNRSSDIISNSVSQS